MNPFDRLDHMANRAIDGINSTRFILTPTATNDGDRQSPNARPTTSAARKAGRTQIEGQAIFDYASIEAGIQLGVRKSYRESNDLRALQVAREPIASIDRRRYLPLKEQYPDQGWIIWFPDRPDLPTFEIASVQPDGHGRIVLKLVARGDQPEDGEGC